MVSLSKAAERGDHGQRAPDPAPYDSVQTFHTNADTDDTTAAAHHTIGANANQAAGGDHTHDGGSSSPLFQGRAIAGVRGSVAYQQSIEALLVSLGASNTAT